MPSITPLHYACVTKNVTRMEKKFNRNNLSISSTSSASSASSTSSEPPLSPGLNSRKALLSPSNYLLNSPPVSPSLPSLIPRHGKKSQTSLLWRLRKVVVVFGAVLVLTWLAVSYFFYPSSSSRYSTGEFEIVGANSLPEEPMAIMMNDDRGRKKWTVSIPAHHDFPLAPSQYHEICQQAEHIGHELNPSRKTKRHTGYYAHDAYFVDVADAQKQGLLPNINKEGKIGEKVIPDDPIAGRRPCGKSLTYVMETSDAGMGSTLMGMWMAYGLAKKEGRAFFIDDSKWPYGNYSQYFSMPQHPNCLPPPATHRLPCPHSAAHLIVSAATFPFTFGQAFTNQFTDQKKLSDAARRKPMFDLLRAGYEGLFHLADQGDADYVLQRTKREFNDVRKHGGMNVGMHIRRGDLHPWDYQYERDYLPISMYMDEARQILIERYEHDEPAEDDGDHDEDGKLHINGQAMTIEEIAAMQNDEAIAAAATKGGKGATKNKKASNLIPRHGAAGLMASKVYVGSDDADVYVAPEISRTIRAQDRIILASKSQLEQAQGGRTNPWVDEIHGWEGGFYRDQFFNLGRSDADRFQYKNKLVASGGHAMQEADESLEFKHVGGVMLEDENPDNFVAPPQAAMALRQLVGRAYLLDLAVLSQSDAVVCAVSASACRILAVMMGWDKAIKENKWRNVDGGYGWRGMVVPE